MKSPSLLNWQEQIRSVHNLFWFRFRQWFRWSRKGYSESSPKDTPFVALAQSINDKYCFTDYGVHLFPRHWIRNLATLWILEQMFGEDSHPSPLSIAEPCCQDFSRLPAISRFFESRQVVTEITGVEIDAFVPLKGFYSRWDHAQYYRSLVPQKTNYISADYFNYLAPTDLILCFYPFLSAAPALAWGLPATIASSLLWTQSFERNLKTNGQVLVVHQGDWEEREFDLARKKSSLKIVRRRVLSCPFFPSRYPMHASLYQKQQAEDGTEGQKDQDC